MAGICGIIFKNNSGNPADTRGIIERMMGRLGCHEHQPSRQVAFSDIGFGNVSQISDVQNSNFVFSETLGVSCIVDGLVFVAQEIKSSIQKEFQLPQGAPDKEYLPFLFTAYGKNLTEKISGWYNLMVYDQKNETGFLFNDILGYSPLYCYEDSKVFLFSSKIESLLASEQIPEKKFDLTTCMEHIFFNYSLSDHTFIKGINTLPPASAVGFKPGKQPFFYHYREFSDFFTGIEGNKLNGFNLLDEGLKNAIQKVGIQSDKKVNLTLTGGWDSRVVLSYLMPVKNHLKAYSFGAPGSPDISIAQLISSSEQIPYQPFILDQEYLDNNFLQAAGKTIMFSNGTRHFKRAHFLYAIGQIAEFSDTIVSGIYGDEVLKVTRPKPGDVISKNLIDLISCDFNKDLLLNHVKSDSICMTFPFPHACFEDLTGRVEKIKEELSDYRKLQEKYYHVRFQVILRKFFGAEINGYNDFCYNFSPFLDTDFLKAYFRSSFCGLFYPFNSDSLALKKQTTELYGWLIRKNHKSLLYYPTDRGYTMADALSLTGTLKILLSRSLKKKQITDPFNTRKTTDLFKKILDKETVVSGIKDFTIRKEHLSRADNPNALSLLFWMGRIQETYNVD